MTQKWYNSESMQMLPWNKMIGKECEIITNQLKAMDLEGGIISDLYKKGITSTTKMGLM